MKRIISVILALIILLSLCSQFTFADSAVNTITTKTEFLSMSPSGNYKLDADIDLGTLSNGCVVTEFLGTLDGNGHTLTYSLSGAFEKAGLFQKLSGTVKNLNLSVNATVSSLAGKRGLYVGGVCATMTGTGEIINCTVAGAMKLSSKTTLYAGGLVGNTTDSISDSAFISNSVNNCNITVTNPDSFVTSEFRIGGIAATGSDFENCVNNAVLTASCTNAQIVYVGGICATESSETSIKYSVNNNAVFGAAAETVYAGGIVATVGRFSNCIIQLCHNNGSVDSYIKGYVVSGDANNSSMADAFAASGGIIAQAANKNTFTPGYQYAVGESQSIIRDCSNSGEISARCNDTLSNKTYASGICAQNYGFIYRVFDRHSGQLSAKVTGPVFAALNENGTLRGGVYDSYYAKTTEQYSTSVGVSDSAYFSVTAVENTAVKSAFPALDFNKKWKLDSSVGYPEILGINSASLENAHKHNYSITKYTSVDHWLECECTAINKTFTHTFANSCDTTCEGCDFVRAITHDHKPAYDDNNHFDKCTVCGDVVNSKPHEFINACDTDCDCGYIRTITHDYKPAYDDDNHFEKCTVCGDKINVVPHVFLSVCDTTCDCGYIRTVPHDYKPTFNDSHHFEKCSLCDDIINSQPHKYDGHSDTVCDCGYERASQHDYQPSFDDNNHYKECTICFDKIEVTPHVFENACDTDCACGYIRVVEPHVYDNACDVDCNICSAIRPVEPHKYDNACDKFCNECNAERPVEPHVYDNACDKFCNICQAERPVEPHVYDNACDKFCNICNAERPVEPHKYDNACDKFCNICNAERPVEPHVYDNACDKFCNICQAERTVEPHKYDNACDKFCNICQAERPVEPHKYDNACDKFCNICNAERTVEPHVYDNACDKFCNVCQAERPVEPHVYDNACDKDCNVCKAVRTVEPHKYDNAFDAFCNICKAERTPPNTPTRSFVDVPANAWYKYYVDYAVAYGLFSGTSDTTFSPNADMTRAQFVQVLANLSGAKLDNSKASGFSDAPAGKWFTGAVKWAVDNGIASGIGGGKFNPTGKIDRQQMCMMLVNYVENYKKTSLKEKVSYKTFADDKEIAGWAKTAVIKCFKAGLVSGTGNNKFSPKVVANRATGATIFTNFHKEYIA